MRHLLEDLAELQVPSARLIRKKRFSSAELIVHIAGKSKPDLSVWPILRKNPNRRSNQSVLAA
ncbi:hypothetical protein A6X21_17545 [Planctopirus hydrillae]|uniref:Uncharacterized protein n=1 Tax=Planctopirus hydrillae TaxID=1841610 RepID=A0A1C3ELR6_9PLAN|nr:hypothetical protein A6X21_17545 [Planctopirus hydrillae]